MDTEMVRGDCMQVTRVRTGQTICQYQPRGDWAAGVHCHRDFGRGESFSYN